MLYRNEEYESVANELIAAIDCLEYLRDGASFVVLSSDKAKTTNGKIVLGECQLIPSSYRWYIPFDFQIIIYDPNIIEFNAEQLNILLIHEMLHMGIDYSGNEPKPYIRPHDIEEFNEIISDYGLDWSNICQEETTLTAEKT